MKKILVGYIQDGKHSGIDKYLLSFCRVAHEEGVVLDFLTDEVTADMAEELGGMGFGLFPVPSLKHPLAQYRAIKAILKQGEYDGAYFNISEAFNCPGLLAAKAAKVPVRMVHSHSSGVDRANAAVRRVRTALNRLFRPVVSRAATKRYACSQVAGRWLFNRDFTIIYNAVDKSRFGYDPALRASTREVLGLTDEPVFVHVGNFCYQKNHFFLMDVMKEIVAREPRAVLLAVGVGVDFDAVRQYAAELGIEQSVRFLGLRSDVPALLDAADGLIFPSRFEGLSITCIEAQIAGLPCLLSDGLSPETQITPKVTFLPAVDAAEWAHTALSMLAQRGEAILDEKELQNYDIANQKEQLRSILKGE